MSSTFPKRVVITGIGIITSIGEDKKSFQDGLFGGKCGIGPVSVFDVSGFACQLAAQVKKKDLGALLPQAAIKRGSRCDFLGMRAALEAIDDAGPVIENYNRDRIGVILGGGAGGMLSLEKYRRAEQQKKTRAFPSWILPVAPCTLTDFLANYFKITGPRATISTACSSSTTSLGLGFDLIRSGQLDMVVTGGSEALSELTFSGFNALKVMSPEPCRPFAENRKGLSLGEGAAILIMEECVAAKKRGANIYGEILGYATNSDAYHMTSPDPKAKGMTAVMQNALKMAEIDPSQVDYLNAHGTATPINDRMETKAIKAAFGEKIAKKLAISSTKSMVGHCLGASGAIEAAATIMAVYNQIAPPTINLTKPDKECDLNYIPETAQPKNIKIAMTNSFAFGGNNTSLVMAELNR